MKSGAAMYFTVSQRWPWMCRNRDRGTQIGGCRNCGMRNADCGMPDPRCEVRNGPMWNADRRVEPGGQGGIGWGAGRTGICGLTELCEMDMRNNFWSGLECMASGEGLMADWEWAFGSTTKVVAPFLNP